MAKITKLATTINTDLSDNYQLSHQRLVEETFKDFSTSISNDNDKTDIINKLCEKIPKENLMVTSLKNSNIYHHIALLKYYDFINMTASITLAQAFIVALLILVRKCQRLK